MSQSPVAATGAAPVDTPSPLPIVKMPTTAINSGRTGPVIRTAGCLIIGDEILNGKTADTNSNFFAKYCFDLGIDLKRIEVIADDEAEIVEASRRMVQKYDFVITSGGIGPTHDDITYSSLANAFSQPLEYHEETLHRMAEMSKHRPNLNTQTDAQRLARNRMGLFPKGSEVLFVDEELWVPVVRLEGKLCIFPGIPFLFRKMLEGLKPFLVLPHASDKSFRYLIRTSQPESFIAPYLTSLSERLTEEAAGKPESERIRVGSYPAFQQSVTVSLVGKDIERIKAIGEEVAREIGGTIVFTEEEEEAK